MHKRYLWLMAGALAFMASASRPAHAAAAPVPGAPTTPTPWVHEDIGGPGAAGDSKVTGTGASAVWTVTGSGADIQNAADQFQFAYTNLTGDGGVTARILSQVPGEPTWTKTGVMLRESNAAGSRMATFNFTSNAGLEGGSREDTDGGWMGPPGSSGVGRHRLAAPIWLRVQHKGTDFQVLSSDDGVGWKEWGHITVAMDLTKPILAGLCVTSHMDGSLASATFDNVSVSSDVFPNAPPGPEGVQAGAGDGAVVLTFGGAPNAVGYNIYRSVQGDTADAPVLVNATKPTLNHWLVDDGGGAGLKNGTNYIYEVKGVLQDKSETLGSDLVTATPNPALPGGLVTYNLATLYPGSVTVDTAKKVINVRSSGGEFWDNQDSQSFAATAVDGDFTITATLNAAPTIENGGTSNSGKAGLLMREGLEFGAPYAYVFASVMRDPEILFEVRRVPLGNGTSSDAFPDNQSAGATNFADFKFPVVMQLKRSGTTLSARESHDGGTTWIDEGNAQDFARMPTTTYIGIAATALSDGMYLDAVFDAPSFSITQP